MYNKVELCGMNTAKLPVLTEAEKRELLARAHAQTDALRHISGQIKEFADAGGAHLPCGRRDQFIVIHHRTVHSLSSISSS